MIDTLTVSGVDDSCLCYKPLHIDNGPTLHYWFAYLGDTRCGGVVEDEPGAAELTMVLEDSDSTFYARAGTSDVLADKLNEDQEH